MLKALTWDRCSVFMSHEYHLSQDWYSHHILQFKRCYTPEATGAHQGQERNIFELVGQVTNSPQEDN